jgi:membrane-bound inhibitor of C-type lysozyme
MVRTGKAAAVFAALICFAIVASARADDDMIDNPAYQSWAKYKVGTWVEYQTDSEAMGSKNTIITTQTLKSLTPDAATVVIQSSMTVSGNKMDMPPQTQEITSKIKRPPAAAATSNAPQIEKGTEDVKVGDKTYACKWTQVTTEQNGMKTVAKTWSCDDVPGSIVRIESSTTGSMTATNKMALVECKIQ